MIVNRDRTMVLSSMSAIEGDAIWSLDVASGQVRTIPQNTGARATSLYSSNSERFVAVHHFDGARFLASVGLFSAPEVTLSSATYDGRSSLVGHAAAWDGLPQLFVQFLEQPWNDYVLVSVSPAGAFVHRLDWYDSSYDKGAQSVADVIALPDPRYALISVKRSSVLIVHDLETGKAHHKVSLGGGNGDPRLMLRHDEVWAADCDTLAVIDARSWQVLRKKKLQRNRQSIGGYSLSADGTCCVARPHRGDVVAVDAHLKIQKSAKLGRLPHEAVQLPNGDVIARDWKSGDLLRGRMEPYSWIKGWWP